MQIQVNTDNHIAGSADRTRQIEELITTALERFRDRITRVEVHLTDESGPKNRPNDKRCVMEARPAGLQPISVSDDASTIEQAVSGAIAKLEKLVERTLERLNDPRGRASFSGDPT